MNWFRKTPQAHPQPEAPEGVRLVRPGLDTIDCDMLRDPGQDANGCAAWIAVPKSGERLAYRLDVDRLEVSVLPGKTFIFLDLDVGL